MPRVTAQLLKGARAGNSDALFILATAIQEDPHYKVSYIEIALEHLRVDQLPEVCALLATGTITDQGKTRVTTAVAGLGCALAAATACTSSAAAKRATVSKLIEALDGVVGWIDILIRHLPLLYTNWEQDVSPVEGLFRDICQLMSSLIHLDDQLAMAMFSSQKVLNTVRIIWSLNLETSPARTTPMDKICAVLKLMADITLDSPEGKFHLLQALVSSPPFLSSFCVGLSWRFGNTVTYHRYYKSNDDTVTRIFRLGAITRVLFEGVRNPIVSAALRLSKLFPSWITTLLELQEILPPSHLHFHVQTALLLASNRHGRPTHSVAETITAGIIPLFIPILSNLDWGSRDDVLDVLRVIQHLSRLALYPRPSNALDLALKLEYDLLSAFNQGVAGNIIAQVWSGLWKGMHLVNRALSDLARDAKQVVICDNHLHHQATGRSSEYPSRSSQCCSGCHLVVYCGEACQKEDWDQRHQMECRFMKRTFDERKRETVQYSHKSRQLHIQMLLTVFHDEYSNVLDGRDQSRSNEAILMMDASSGLPHPKLLEGVPLVEFQSMFFGRFDSPEMDARKDGIIKDFVAQSPSTSKRLLALVLFWDIDHRIHLLVETSRDSTDPGKEGSYTVTQSVVSIEDTRSSKYQYQSRFEADMIELFNGGKDM
ncbi:hypothetical protein BKA70DRAFT_1309045 [Coprinopsis sp. MPI-PUGE-AT-0042]|nr:hypothetical protein BKA70DRAFT_1309045 [Coprinopsis sp. MPI-PUGE-AT-0042]